MSMRLVPSVKTRQLRRRVQMLMITLLNYNDGIVTSCNRKYGVGLFTYLNDLRDALDGAYDFSDEDQGDLLSGGGGD